MLSITGYDAGLSLSLVWAISKNADLFYALISARSNSAKG